MKKSFTLNGVWIFNVGYDFFKVLEKDILCIGTNIFYSLDLVYLKIDFYEFQKNIII